MSTHLTTARGDGGGSRRWWVLAAAGGGYLVLSLVLWWHVDGHLATATTCGCGDASLTLWVIRWPAYALAHGLNPFFSSKLLVPTGINMAPNSLALGVGAAPVTWAFGPVASMNLIDILSPALSALSMFWLLDRWVAWTPAAAVGGLFFGFSPFVLVSLAFAHPNFGLLAVIPPMVACVEDLVVRHRHRPVRVGILLGVLATLQFFISVEVLLLLVLFSVLGAVVAVVLVPSPRAATVRAAAGRALPGVTAAAGTAAVLLAYPLWSFFAGPAHLVGRAWPNSPAGTVAATPSGFVTGTLSPALVGIMRALGGYQGPPLPGLSFVGAGMAVVLVVGLVVWRHDRRLWFFGILAVTAAALSLGVGTGPWHPWRLFVHVPVLDNVVPVNITAVTDLCLAVVLALVLDHTRAAVARRWGGRWSTAAGALVAVIALVPLVVALWPNVPFTTRAVVVPHWFARVDATSPAHTLPANAVVLPYPPALGGIQASMTWQAEGDLSYSMVGGGGPGVAPSRAGAERPGFDVLARAALPLGPAPGPTAANLGAVRRALAGWGTTTVVVPDQPRMPTYDRGRSVAYAVGLFTAATGRAPVLRDDAWVWDDLTDLPPPVPLDPATFAACTGEGAPTAPVAPVASCVLAHRSGT